MPLLMMWKFDFKSFINLMSLIFYQSSEQERIRTYERYIFPSWHYEIFPAVQLEQLMTGLIIIFLSSRSTPLLSSSNRRQRQETWAAPSWVPVGSAPASAFTCHRSLKGAMLINCPRCFHVKQIAWSWLPVGGGPCHNRCSFSRTVYHSSLPGFGHGIAWGIIAHNLKTISWSVYTTASNPQRGTHTNCETTNTYTN